jgi:hypothetical protein
MKKEKFKLGPEQIKWVETLEKYPDRQIQTYLGGVTKDEGIKACCLGQGLLCLNEGKIEKVLEDGSIVDRTSYGELEYSSLRYSYVKLGLYDEEGFFKNCNFDYLKNQKSLSGLNDNSFTWPEIAKIIRRNPRNVFKESK